MKKIAIIFAIVGLIAVVAYASFEDLKELNVERKASMSEEELAAFRKNLDELSERHGVDVSSEEKQEDNASLKEIFKKNYREEAKLAKIMSEARAEVDAEFQVNTPRENIQIDQTALFYTYSTIAQTLAGAFGILGAFMLFKLQSINNSIEGVCSIIYTGILTGSGRSSAKEEVRIPYVQQKWYEFYDAIKDRPFPDLFSGGTRQIPDNEFETCRDKLKEALSQRSSIVRLLKSTLWITLIAISLSIVLLPLVPVLDKYFLVSCILVVITIILSMVCIVRYVNLVIKALDLKGNKPELKQVKLEDTKQQ